MKPLSLYRVVFAFAIALFVSLAGAQGLTPVVDSGGASWSAVILIVLAVVVVAGLVVWHKRSPTTEAKALADANAALKGALASAHTHIDSLLASLKEYMESKTPPAPEPVVPAGPTPEQIAAVAAAEKALAEARAAAGIAPPT